jgi:hypothetical protein
MLDVVLTLAKSNSQHSSHFSTTYRKIAILFFEFILYSVGTVRSFLEKKKDKIAGVVFFVLGHHLTYRYANDT